MKNNELKLNRFIEKAKIRFGDIFDYSNVIYKNNKTKVKIVCSIHGEFEISPDNFINKSKYGCPKCGINDRGFNKRLSIEEFINRSQSVHKNKYIYDKVNYVDIHTKVIITCLQHGDFEQDPASHLKGTCCPKCGYEISSTKQQLTQLEFLNKCLNIHGNKYDYSKVVYTGIYNPITIICKEHGEFLQLPAVHFQGCGCDKCRLKNQNKLYDLLKNSFPNECIE
jgi:hypothetical protein